MQAATRFLSLLMSRTKHLCRAICALPFALALVLASTDLRAEVGLNDGAISATRGTLRGALLPAQSLQLSSPASGVIESFGADEGQSVAAGDLLVQLNADIERAEVARAEAVLESANAESDRTKRELDRTIKLRRDSIGAEKDLDDAQSARQLAIARGKQASAELAIARARLAERAIRAKISGILFRRTRAVGEAVERLEPVVHLVDVSRLELVIYATADLLGRFKVHQSFRLLVDSGPARGTSIEGNVTFVDPTMDPDSATFKVRIQVSPTETIQPGISVILQLPSETN